MKKQAIQQLKALSAEQLRKELISNREKLRAMKFDLYNGKVKNVSLIREIKKTIARIMTFSRAS